MSTSYESPRKRFLRRFRRQHLAVISGIYLAVLAAVALSAGVVAPYDPTEINLQNTFAGFSWDHPFGTDESGRDLFSRVIYGARVSLLAAFQAVGIALAIGMIPGLAAGYFGGWVDVIISRITDTVMSFPPLLLAIAIVGVFGPNLRNAMLAVGIIFFPRFVRLARSAAIGVRNETYVESAQAIGLPSRTILVRHVLPNTLSPIMVQIALSLGFAMLAEASLSFLGLGVQPPDASWGAIVGRSYRFLSTAPHLVIVPSIAIAVTVLAFSMLGDGLRDSMGRETR